MFNFIASKLPLLCFSSLFPILSSLNCSIPWNRATLLIIHSSSISPGNGSGFLQDSIIRSANEISMANANSSPSFFTALPPSQQGLHMAQWYPGCVCQFHQGITMRDQRRREHPRCRGQQDKVSQADRASWLNLAPDKCFYGTQSPGVFGSLWQSLPVSDQPL